MASFSGCTGLFQYWAGLGFFTSRTPKPHFSHPVFSPHGPKPHSGQVLPEPQWGIATIPAGWFPKLMPWAIASELLLQAERVSAERAHQVGIINRIVPKDQLMAEAEKIATRICGLSPVAVQGMKESMVCAAALDYSAIDQITASVQNRVMNSEDRREGGRAFVEQSEVDWPGR